MIAVYYVVLVTTQFGCDRIVRYADKDGDLWSNDDPAVRFGSQEAAEDAALNVTKKYPQAVVEVCPEMFDMIPF